MNNGGRFFLSVLTLIIIGSCKEDAKNEYNSGLTKDSSPVTSKISESSLVANGHDERTFETNNSNVKIDNGLTAKLEGVWKPTKGSLKFLNTTLDIGDRIVFYNELYPVGTGWGIIKYSRAAKVYFSEHGSYIYEYYVDKTGKLVFTEYDYRNDDLTFKDKPMPIKQIVNLKWEADSSVILSIDKLSVLLAKQ